MFIHINNSRNQSGFEIDKIISGENFYLEINIGGSFRSRNVRRAIKKCPASYPIISDIPLPRKYSRRMLRCDGFDTLLLINTFAETASYCDRALIIDPDGEFTDYLLFALTRVRMMYVVTADKDRYDFANRHALRTAGCSAVITERIPDELNFPVILLSKNTARSVAPPVSSLVFGDGGYLPFGDTVVFRNKRLNYGLSAALYTALSNSRMGLCSSPVVCRNGKLVRVETLKALLDNKASYSYN